MKRYALLSLFVTLIMLPNSAIGFQEPAIDLTAFSGNWRGTETLIQAGNCTIDGTDSLTVSANFWWIVDEFGYMTIVDSVFMSQNWEGKMESDSSVVMGKGFWVECVASANYEVAQYAGKIEDNSGVLQLTVESLEEWCPAPQSCIFRVTYSLTKEHTITSVAEQAQMRIPEGFYLSQNYPNPFNPETTIAYQLPKPGKVSIKIYNFSGQVVRSLFVGQQNQGSHSVLWDGKDGSGLNVSSGVYVVRMVAGTLTASQKISLIR
jgi:hypothetical protein